MSDDIQFGEVEHAEPEVALRPDQDAHYVTVEIGDVRDGELAIFVDLDVMRDMEAHALSNTRVELGGVMLGKQLLDDRGRPYVLITDSLRAEHYEATKGSFKFTHDTWSQITRQRDEFHPDLEMVGWYHTHPGWSVFLSGMDLFICNNFFNRPLDVALVIDPCEQDRGWFQWDDSEPPHTHRTGGFTLITGRYRKDELEYFARIYNKEPDMSYDPRYSSSTPGSTSVQLMDNRKSSMELAVIGLLAMQFLFLLVFGWKALGPVTDGTQVTELKQELEELKAEKAHSELEQIYMTEFNRLALQKTGDPNYAKQLIDLKHNESLLTEGIEGQIAFNRELKRKNTLLQQDVEDEKRKREKQERQLATTRSKLDKTSAAFDAYKEEWGDGKTPGTDWWLVSGVGLLTLGLGLGTGYFLAANRDPNELPDYETERPMSLSQPPINVEPASTDATEQTRNIAEPDVVKFDDEN